MSTQAEVIEAMQADFSQEIEAAKAADPTYQALRKAWAEAGEDGSYSSPEFIAMDARLSHLVKTVEHAAEVKAGATWRTA